MASQVLDQRTAHPKTAATAAPRLTPRFTPHGHLLLEPADDAPALDVKLGARLRTAFARGTGDGLLQLGVAEIGQTLPPVFAWWREFAARYVGMRCSGTETTALSKSELAVLALTAPVMAGAEYLTPDALSVLWADLDAAFDAALASAGTDLETFLKGHNAAWNVVGRVHFNLAENRRDSEAPFAFMATYTTRLSAQAKAQHVPLGQALREYAGAAKREKLLSLLVPVQRAAQSCPWLKPLVDTGEIFHPLRWSPSDAAQFLASVPDFERAGVVVRMPESASRLYWISALP
jgi:hypothetical protein